MEAARGEACGFCGRRERGNHVRAEIWLGRGARAGQIMVLGHVDTVYPLGTLAKMPFRVAEGRAWGPGTFDMKGGTRAGALCGGCSARGWASQPRNASCFCGLPMKRSAARVRGGRSSRKRGGATLCWCSSRRSGRDGRLKTQRKGVGGAEIIVTGRSAHAGIDPEKGVNAVHELALQIERLMRLNDPRRGITVQTTVVSGGTLTNVVPEHAQALVDIRYARLADAARHQSQAARMCGPS